MITPRRTRLLRVPGLRALQRAIAQTACPPDVARTRACAVIVPTTAAAAELRLTLENLLLLSAEHVHDDARRAFVLPDLVTRDGWYTRMHERLPAAPFLLSPLEREVLATRRPARRSEKASSRRSNFARVSSASCSHSMTICGASAGPWTRSSA
ncbi:MAG: hypothetical protein IMZ55_03990 [Acidobacteria bacterium]|nr:hypothetical protein [Acidobacteriota bacterium]